jgi:hypothetical protein
VKGGDRVAFSLTGLRFLRDAQLFRERPAGERPGEVARRRWADNERQVGTVTGIGPSGGVTVAWDGGKVQAYAEHLLYVIPEGGSK